MQVETDEESSAAPRLSESSLLALAPVDRAIVAICSIFYAPTPRTDIARALGDLGYRNERRAFKPEDVLPMLEALTEKGWLRGETHWRVAPEIIHLVTLRAGVDGELERMARVVREHRPLTAGGRDTPNYNSWDEAVRELRIEVYSKRWGEARNSLGRMGPGAFAEICRPFDASWVSSLPDDLQRRALKDVLEASVRELVPADAALALFEKMDDLDDNHHRVLVEQLILRGRFDDAQRLLEQRSSLEARAGRGWLLAVRGEWSDAAAAFERALTAYLKECGKRARFFPDRAGVFFILSLIASGDPAKVERAKVLADAAAQPGISAMRHAHEILAPLSEVLLHRLEPESAPHAGSELDTVKIDPLERLLRALAAIWIGKRVARGLADHLVEQALRAESAGYLWLAAQSADALCAIQPAQGDRIQALRARLMGASLASAVARSEKWSSALDVLAAIAGDGAGSSREEADSSRRLVWVVTEHHQRLDMDAREQSRSKRTWSKGRPVALKRLHAESASISFLTEADRRACLAIEEHVSYTYGRYRDSWYSIDVGRALRMLAGQPNVFLEVDGSLVPAVIRVRRPKLSVEASPDGAFRVALEPFPGSDQEHAQVRRASNNTIDVVELEEKHHAIAKVLGKAGLELPPAAASRLREVVSALSDIVAVDAQPATGSAAPGGDRLSRVVARRLGEGVSIEGTIEALARCPSLAAAAVSADQFDLPERDQALEALIELRAADPSLELEWPDGRVLSVTEPISVDRLSLSFRAAGDRFEVGGSLETGGDEPLALPTLFEYLAVSPGRFLRLGQDDRFLALTAELEDRLHELRALAQPGAGDRLHFHRLSVRRIEELVSGASVERDEAWTKQCTRMTATGQDAAVPSTLRGELRPYQLDGFRWLARLARWDAGACLADEMGLGKTMQALALLLLRAPEGPSLVVAPTSVLSSWVHEAARFAPTLRVRLYVGEGREHMLEDLGPLDLVLASYQILQQDVDVLERVRFEVALLDEAQAIKNAETLRARAAYRLEARQRVVTTGTPIENRLGELWSLFNFLNPGLLGSREAFEDRIARPIEKRSDARVLARLKRLVAPFLLRRTKSSVMEELPEKTEVTLRVELERNELALYEVIREKALQEIAGMRSEGGLRMQLLAAIMRLRRAASNARLVLPDVDAPSAKLAALGELLDELLPSGHKVLVFSQFVDHLALVRALLEERKVSFQYLDGSTPLAKRKGAIDAFQAGEGDVFLISLKAGGFGLNLTAADYVVHMDPWWNPAAEDQASDRAHRIGQTRPVTIYRLVAKDTIEDKIVELHARKRGLATMLLEGSDLPARMTEEEMLQLIRGR